MKVCYKCQIEKDESEFHKNKQIEGGFHYYCKECVKQYQDGVRLKRREYDKKYYRENMERKKEYDARPEIKERRKQRKKQYNAKPETKKRNNQRAKERCQTDSCYKLRKCISTTIWRGLKNNGGSKRGSSILSKLPYTMQELKQHIESLWESWMSWKNHGPYDPNRKTWQIDHIKPHSCFHYENMDCEEFRKCWSLSNLRPLESLANIKKGNK
jgi:hypothetical protein